MSKDDFDAVKRQDSGRGRPPKELLNSRNFLTGITIERINKRIMDKRRQEYILRKPKALNHIVFQFNNGYERLPEGRDKTIKKASYIISAITFRQPFDDGNKSTGLIIGTGYLALHGLTLPRNTEKQKKEIFSLLNEVMISTKSHEDVEALLMKRVVNRT